MYNKTMPANSHIEEVTQDDGTTSEKLLMEFSNGSLKQLRELSKFFGVKGDDPSDAVKLAISFLQNIKDRSNKERKDDES